MRISSRSSRSLAALAVAGGSALLAVGAAAPAGAYVSTTHLGFVAVRTGTVGVPFAISMDCVTSNGDPVTSMVVHVGTEDYTLGTPVATVDSPTTGLTDYLYTGSFTPRAAGTGPVTITCSTGSDTRTYDEEMSFTFAAGEGTTTTTAAPTSTTVVTPTTAAVLGDQLANTGAHRYTEPMALLGGAMVALGALFVVSTPRRRDA